MVHISSVQASSTSVSSPPAPVANSVFLASHSRPPWRWQWVWMKWCAPTVLWSIPRSPPLWSAAWTSRWLKSSLQPKQNTHTEHDIIWNHQPVPQLRLGLSDIYWIISIHWDFCFCMICKMSTLGDNWVIHMHIIGYFQSNSNVD